MNERNNLYLNKFLMVFESALICTRDVIHPLFIEANLLICLYSLLDLDPS